MAWQLFSVDQYEIVHVALNTPGYPDIYAFVRLYWGGQSHATLWFHRDSAVAIPLNSSSGSGPTLSVNARFRQAQLHDAVDLLRNEKPVSFQWNDTSLGAFLATGNEPVGEAETP
jgi:hypothetical protein